MGLFDKALKDAISKGIQGAVGKAVENAVRPAAEKLANQAAQSVGDAASGKLNELKNAFGEAGAAMAEAEAAAKDVKPEQWEQAFSFLEGMANDMAKDMKICPVCETPVKGGGQFCPQCGAKLPEQTVAQLTLCPQCGKQNSIGAEFCVDCGAMLPGKQLAAAQQQEKDKAVLERWARELPQFPVWTCGGSDFDLAELEKGRFYFSACFKGDEEAARQSVKQYGELLLAAGFRQAGKYPSDEHLYKMVDGVCCHADTEHCQEGDADAPGLYFSIGDEPTGGFDYVKPEPKKPGGLLGGLFG